MLTKFDVLAAGCTVDGKIMGTGERRYRFRAPDKTAYTRTEAGKDGAWQNAHHHKGLLETYVVQTGWIAFAESCDGMRVVGIFGKGAVVTSRPLIDHNVYLPAGSVIHTVQHGKAVGNPENKNNDWYAADTAFDEWSKGLTLENIACMTNVRR